MKLSVKVFREAGMEAKWGHTRNGAPAMFVRDPNGITKHQRETWWMVNDAMWRQVALQGGVREGFNCCTLLGDMFSIPA